MRRSLSALAAVLSLSLLASTIASAQEPQRGDLTGRFILLGQPPAPRPIAGLGPRAPRNLVDESLVLGPGQGIANIVVFLQPAPGTAFPAPPPGAVPQGATIAATRARFDPHVAVVPIGERLDLVNRDQVAHNVRADLMTNDSFNHLIPRGATVPLQFNLEERFPAKVSDSIFSWMNGYLLIAPTTYNAVADAKGAFKISDLPVGKWTFKVWHERSGHVENVTIGRNAVKWPKGILEMEIKPGKNDLGDVMIPAAEF